MIHFEYLIYFIDQEIEKSFDMIKHIQDNNKFLIKEIKKSGLTKEDIIDFYLEKVKCLDLLKDFICEKTIIS